MEQLLNFQDGLTKLEIARIEFFSGIADIFLNEKEAPFTIEEVDNLCYKVLCLIYEFMSRHKLEGDTPNFDVVSKDGAFGVSWKEPEQLNAWFEKHFGINETIEPGVFDTKIHNYYGRLKVRRSEDMYFLELEDHSSVNACRISPKLAYLLLKETGVDQ